MRDLKIIKQLLVMLIFMVLLNLGLTGYSIVRNEVSNKEFAARVSQESQQREAQLAVRLDATMQRQIMGIREGFISWRVDQVSQTRKMVALEVSIQLMQQLDEAKK